ncbi:MAG: chloride channel protein [Ferrovibrio sp.]|uniref:chloride channel protein n=1 Tax=Ferrovibrio sp. TaxID=1917215 RepID=UPI0026230F7B|nr:chloride channel protein [Ferrovibrio sp.]MCW0235759.1 chloride channel protein [Ferrovibrio sp.]
MNLSQDAHANRNPFLMVWQARAVFWCGAIAVGLVAVVFADACGWAIRYHDKMIVRWPLAAPFITPFGFAAAVYLTRRFSPAAKGSGIPQAIAALAAADDIQRSRLLSLRIAAGKIALMLVGLLSGASIGREGPTVHIGASIMDALGRFAHFPSEQLRRGLVLAGGAAGLAAAFNTPIAGIVFAVEEMARSFEERTTGTLITAVVLAGVVATGLLGNYTYFGVANAHLLTWRAWIAVPLCGVSGGLLGGLFARILVRGSDLLAPLSTRKAVFMAASLGLIVSALGLVSHGATYGSGYEQAHGLLTGEVSPGLLFPILKWLATLASYLTGMPGGLFSPSLSTGAGIGAALSPLVPQTSLATMIVLGMVGYFTGVTQSPLTGAVIVMEMVDDHSLILPMLATCFLALGVSRLLCKEPLYRALAKPFLRQIDQAGPGRLG